MGDSDRPVGGRTIVGVSIAQCGVQSGVQSGVAVTSIISLRWSSEAELISTASWRFSSALACAFNSFHCCSCSAAAAADAALISSIEVLHDAPRHFFT